jgi:BON domain
MTSRGRLVRSLALVLALALAGATPAVAAGRTIGQVIDDATITAEIKAKLAADKLSNLTKIDVKSDTGNVTLGGTVDSVERRERAVQIATNVGGVKSVVNNIAVAGSTAAAPSTTPPGSVPPLPSTAGVEATGTIASVDPATGTITLTDGRVLRATDQTLVWQPTTVGALKPGTQVLVRGAAPAGYQASASRNWRMATVTRVDRANNELVLNDGSTVKVSSATRVHRGNDRLSLDQLDPGSEVVVYTASPAATEASEVAVVWTPTASVR